MKVENNCTLYLKSSNKKLDAHNAPYYAIYSKALNKKLTYIVTWTIDGLRKAIRDDGIKNTKYYCYARQTDKRKTRFINYIVYGYDPCRDKFIKKEYQTLTSANAFLKTHIRRGCICDANNNIIKEV